MSQIHIISNRENRELHWIEVSSELAWKMTRKGSDQVAQDVGVPVNALLDMIDGTRGFNRRVLRYLGIQRIARYRYRYLEQGETV